MTGEVLIELLFSIFFIFRRDLSMMDVACSSSSVLTGAGSSWSGWFDH